MLISLCITTGIALALIGDADVGKTSLANTFITKKFEEGFKLPPLGYHEGEIDILISIPN